MAYFGPLTAEISLPVWGTRTIVSRLGFITAATSLTVGQPNFAQSLAVSWAGALYIHFEALAPNGILQGAKFTLYLSLAFSYIGSGTRVVDVSQTFRRSAEAPPIHGRAAIMMGIGPDSSSFFFSFLAYSQPSQIGCLPYFHI